MELGQHDDDLIVGAEIIAIDRTRAYIGKQSAPTDKI